MTASPSSEHPRFIWATRGRTWGFRFLRNGGFTDPLAVYENAFSTIEDQPEAWRRIDDKVAVRFPDPEGRRDVAGRVIQHDFVVLDDSADGITLLEEGRERLWREVEEEFDEVWEQSQPPPTRG